MKPSKYPPNWWRDGRDPKAERAEVKRRDENRRRAQDERLKRAQGQKDFLERYK